MATVRFPIPATNRLASLPVEALSHILAHLLTTAVASNDQLETKGTITRFHSKQPPPLEIGAYLKRLATTSSLRHVSSRETDPLTPHLGW